MANPEHLAILKQGVEQWNVWRKLNRRVHPDLRGGSLSKASCHGATVSDASLSRADLRRREPEQSGPSVRKPQRGDTRGGGSNQCKFTGGKPHRGKTQPSGPNWRKPLRCIRLS